MKAGDIEFDNFFYNPPNQTTAFGDKITASENGVFSPVNLDCWIKCETGNIQMVPTFQGKVIEITMKGVMELATNFTKIEVVIEGKKEIMFKKPAPVIAV
jgi:hypothetical protein